MGTPCRQHSSCLPVMKRVKNLLITHTGKFKAAVAGAPITNMISMYSLIYWNTGSTNQPIFESSHGGLTPGYWENYDAFKRNSPAADLNH